MKYSGLCGLLLFLFIHTGFGQSKAPTGNLDRPKLVVGIVVDQMRWDYLYRYYDKFGNDGFRRLLREGYSCQNTYITHLPSFTAVGHSTIYTGSVPAIHGITGNDWTDQQTGRSTYCTDDSLVHTVGSSSKAGEMSPHNLLATTITDELRLATNFRSRVIGVSLKDRASILPAGHKPTAAFWWDDASGNFITSSWYMDELPDFAKRFNARRIPEKLVSKNWELLRGKKEYVQSTDDNVSWEGRFKGESGSGFPHAVKSLYAENHSVLRTTPFGNSLTLQFAQATVNAYHLGQEDATDFLAINCASTDYVGHMFGPNSMEVEDTYLRLDQDLAEFLNFLDKQVGPNNYLLFLSADHGAAHSVGFMESNEMPAGLLPVGDWKTKLNEVLEKQFGQQQIVLSIQNYHVNLNELLIRSARLDRAAIKECIVKTLKDMPGVQFVTDLENGRPSIPEPIASMLINGYNPKRTGPVAIIPEPGWYQGSRTGTTHGNWNPYDTHIPLLFMGWNIRHGETYRNVGMTDIAPTLAALLHIQAPNGCIGSAITELVPTDWK